MTFMKIIFTLICLSYAQGAALANSQPYPVHKEDHYEWMENDNKRTNEWLQDKTLQARNIIDNTAWRKKNETDKKFLTESYNALYQIRDEGENRFYFRVTNKYPYSRLFVKVKNNKERLLIDPPPETGIMFFSPSHDGHYIAYGLSKNGSEISSIKILDVDKDANLKDLIPRVRYPHIVWQADHRSFFYSRLPPEKHHALPSENIAHKKIYLHYLGDDYRKDQVVFYNGMLSDPSINDYNNIEVYASPSSDWLLASTSPSISGFSSSLYTVPRKAINGVKTPWKKIIDENQKVSNFVFFGKWLFLARYNRSSGYTVTRMSLDHPQSGEEKIIEWSNGELMEFVTSNDSLYIAYHDSGVRKFVRVAFDDIKHIHAIPLPFDGEVTALFPSQERNSMLFTLQSWTIPPTIYNYDPDHNTVVNTHLISSDSYGFNEYEAKEVWVLSKDGVRVPLTIIQKKGLVRNGATRTWLSVYGAYGESTFPNFDPSRLIWLRNGGIIAIAHVRGGGELGPAWHEDGRLFKKENSITDFLACADYLIANGYTKKERLVASSASAGGIIVGRAITLRPELFSAVAIDVGILNTARMGYIPIGPMNADEFGSSNTPEGMNNLHKLDAYEHLKDGVHYPAVLLTVGLNDNRVSPWQSAKFAARLDEIARKVKNPNPVLIMAEKNAGHGASTNTQSNKKFLDKVSFFLWRTDDK